jgi:hypothetical protein
MQTRYVALGLLAALAACGTEAKAPGAAVDNPSHLRLSVAPLPADTKLTFTISSGKCSTADPDPRLDEVVVDEGDTEVTVTASIIETESEGRMCAGGGFEVTVPVELKRSLGDRKILDGSCLPPAQVIGVNEQREPCAQTDLEKAQEGAIGKWEPFDAGPLAPRSEPKSVWTGTEMLVVGGLTEEGPVNDGAAFHPSTDKWRRIPDMPHQGRVLAVVWTGRELMTLSMTGTDTLLGPNSSGANAVHLFDPRTDTWRSGPDAPTGLIFPYLAWTGTEAIVWSQGRGGMFDPSTNAWRELPPVGIVTMMPGSRGKWIPKPGVLAVQGNLEPGSSDVRNTGIALFDPKTNQWSGPFKPPIPLSAQAEAVVVGSLEVFAAEFAGPAIAFDAVSREWSEIASAPGPRSPGYFIGIPIDADRAIVRLGGDAVPLGLVDIKTGEWSHAAAPGGMPSPDGAFVWTGKEVLLWGQPFETGPDMTPRAWRWSPQD